MITTCEHCGAIHHSPPNDLTKAERQLYDFIAANPGVGMREIVAHMYGETMPVSTNIISVFIVKANRKLTEVRIKSNRPGPGARYRIVQKEKA